MKTEKQPKKLTAADTKRTTGFRVQTHIKAGPNRRSY